jgi:hypothetical protein
MTAGAPKLAPPSVDRAARRRRFPVAGQKTKTSPAPLVLTSHPRAVVPADVEGVPIWRCGAVIDPHPRLVGAALPAGDGGVPGPGRAPVDGPVGMQAQQAARVDPQGRGPRHAVGGPVHAGVGMEGVTGEERQLALAPGGAAVGRVELGLPAAPSEVVGRGDDLPGIPGVDPDVRLAAGPGLGAGDADVRAGRLGLELESLSFEQDQQKKARPEPSRGQDGPGQLATSLSGTAKGGWILEEPTGIGKPGKRKAPFRREGGLECCGWDSVEATACRP